MNNYFLLLLILLPVAAASGWWMAKREERRKHEENALDLSPDYFKGLNYLINEQPDKAIEVFVKMLEVDTETVETHFALGSLFRRRGEVDRAIRIHQNLIARPTLTQEQRNQALLELGEDYLRAGWFDRAESLFLKLIETEGVMTDVLSAATTADISVPSVASSRKRRVCVPQVAPALRSLCDIYQQEREWDQAIRVAEKLETVTGKNLSPVIAQYYCELAEQARQRQDVDEVSSMVKRALIADPRCVRASILQGDVEMMSGHYSAALMTYKNVEEQDADYLAEVIPRIVDCYNKLGTPQAIMEYLENILQKYADVAPLLAFAELLRDQHREQDAEVFVAAHLNKQPTLPGLACLVDLYLAGSEGRVREYFLVLNAAIKKLLHQQPLYQCGQCGFSGKSLHWQCPGCKKWSTLKPVHGMDETKKE